MSDTPADLFPTLQDQLSAAGPAAAVERLCTTLNEARDYPKLFYALLMKRRLELGLPPVPTTSGDVPADKQHAYEDAIRDACRTVGRLFLDTGDIPSAYTYFRMIGEAEPVAKAIDAYKPGGEDDISGVVEIAFHHGANPKRGFDLILDHWGICRAIGFASEVDPRQHAEIAAYCARALVRSLHQQVLERLRVEIERQQGFAPTANTIAELVEGRDWLFAEDSYLTDVSHLQSVVHLSLHIPDGEELRLARDLCAYGRRLSPMLRGEGVPPFDEMYADHAVFLSILLGDDVDAGLAHFRGKLRTDGEHGTFPAEVLVNLLLKLNRPAEALAIAREYLSDADDRQLSCPGLYELCQKQGNFAALAEIAQQRGDPVHFLAGLIAKR